MLARFKRHQTVHGQRAIQDGLRRGRFGLKDRPFGQVAVPFDQRWDRAHSRENKLIVFPHAIGHRRVVAVDEQRLAFVVALLRMSGEMDFPYMRQREVREIVDRGESVVRRRDEDIVDVEQQAAAGAPRDRRG